MADEVYDLEVNISQLTAICSCGRVRLTLSGSLREHDTLMLTAAIHQHQAQYPNEQHTFTYEVGGQIAQQANE